MAMKGKQLSFTVALIVADRQKGEGKLEAILRRPPSHLATIIQPPVADGKKVARPVHCMSR